MKNEKTNGKLVDAKIQKITGEYFNGLAKTINEKYNELVEIQKKYKRTSKFQTVLKNEVDGDIRYTRIKIEVKDFSREELMIKAMKKNFREVGIKI